MQIDLNLCFPEPREGEVRGPLPKQQLFLDLALDPKGPKYIRYCGGIGSGKTLIGCVTVISLAVLYPGDYLIARQFMPELIDTTYQTFKSICPPELIVDDQIARRTIVLRAANG